jgi:fructokinase
MGNNSFKNIICYGELLWDMLPTGKKPGGAPVNVAVHLKRLGLNPVVVSRVGNDRQGTELSEFLDESGLDTQLISVDDKLPTSEVLVHLDDEKNATYEICEPVAWDNILPSKRLEKKAARSDLIVFGSLAQRNPTTRDTLIHLLNTTNATRLLDVNLRPPHNAPELVQELLLLADFVKLNDSELQQIALWNQVFGNEEYVMRWLASFYNCSVVCVTRGAKGAALLINDKLYEHPGFKVEAVDTVGAGDAFLAALIYGFSKKQPPQKSVEFACAVGAFVASEKGAVPQYSKNNITNFLNKKAEN